MATTPNTPADSFGEYSVIELFAECGFDPTDDLGERRDPSGVARSMPAPAWLERWDAYIRTDDGFIVASNRDEQLMLFALTPSGVVRVEARFDWNSLGAMMFAGAVHALEGSA